MPKRLQPESLQWAAACEKLDLALRDAAEGKVSRAEVEAAFALTQRRIAELEMRLDAVATEFWPQDAK